MVDIRAQDDLRCHRQGAEIRFTETVQVTAAVGFLMVVQPVEQAHDVFDERIVVEFLFHIGPEIVADQLAGRDMETHHIKFIGGQPAVQLEILLPFARDGEAVDHPGQACPLFLAEIRLPLNRLPDFTAQQAYLVILFLAEDTGLGQDAFGNHNLADIMQHGIETQHFKVQAVRTVFFAA